MSFSGECDTFSCKTVGSQLVDTVAGKVFLCDNCAYDFRKELSLDSK